MEVNIVNIIEELTRAIKNQNETIEAMGKEITALKFTIEDLNNKINGNKKTEENKEINESLESLELPKSFI